MKRFVAFMVVLFLSVILTPNFASAVSYISAPPLHQTMGNVPVGNVKADETLFLITWGADIGTIHANGNNLITQKGSPFANEGLKFKLVREDNLKKQLEAYIKGETPFLRATQGMVNQAAELLNRDPRTKPVAFYQLSWSGGEIAGDCLVVSDRVKSLKDIKVIAMQAYGPHLDYATTLFKDAGRNLKDIKIKYTKDLTGTDDTPGEALRKDKEVDAVFVISTDAMKLTSGGKVGIDREGGVKGARIFLSTKTGRKIIPDLYWVRSDYYQANSQKIGKMTHALLLAEESAKNLFKNKEVRKQEYKQMITASAKILLDSEHAVGDVEGAYGDCEMAGFAGNVKFFTDNNWPRNFKRLNEEIQTAYIAIGMLTKKIPIDAAKLDYNSLKAGLAGATDVEVPRFVPAVVAKVVEQRRATGTLEGGALFAFEVYFKPNQKSFSFDMYGEAFDEAIKKAATYSGAVITVEGHTDPLGYLQKKKDKMPEVVLTQQKQGAKNLSVQRAMEVRDALVQYAKSKKIALDNSQFTVIGHGFMQPKSGMCGADPCAPKTEQEWLNNMRVVFQLFNVEAEESVFRPLQ